MLNSINVLKKIFFFIKKKLRSIDIDKYSDEELLHLFRNTGKSEYFGHLFNRYIPLTYGLCLKYLKDENKAQDAIMQLFEDLLCKITNYEIRMFRTWLYGVTRNHCLQLLRRKEVIVDFNDAIMESDEVLHLFDEEHDEQRYSALQDCIEKLPEPQKVSIVQFFMNEMSYADIVEKTGYQLKSVKSYIQNGKRNLKICLDKR